MEKHLVFFGRPTRRMIGKDKQTPSNDSVWMSKCGKYKIESKRWAGSRNGCWVTGYRLTVLATDKTTDHDTFADARFEADCYEDPNFEG